ncbi:hybrid sensor histidine kinase/response regulator [Nocardioides bruguierae]|uniref:hybrid sensor histidine kinase/response regulator n=1 Tax=Nocardioides bruguierae TaxID=2945102 RepID=UPI00202070DA|nr:ATP-binding protein [Nocardioides bruguierae]MCL8024755.1 ATP-binding protein [Nocardioides bruguierae]
MSHPLRGRRPAAWVVAGLGLVVLAMTTLVGLEVAQQSRALVDRVDTTEDLVLANVRTLGQTQREVLRLQVLVVTGADGPTLRRQAAFVTQRTQESALDSHRATLGAADLIAVARQDAQAWRSDLLPDVRALAAVPPARRDPAATRQLLADLEVLEESYFDLVSLGEIYRREQAAQANADNEELVNSTQDLFMWLTGTFATAAVLLAAGGALMFRLHQQRSAAHERLSQLNEDLMWYARIVQATDSILFTIDNDGRFTWVNEAFERTMGYAYSDVTGKRPPDVLHGPATDPETVRALQEKLQDGEQFRCELANYTADGQEIWMAVDVSPVLDEEGAVTGFCAIQSDISERHEAELLLKQARLDAEASARAKAAFLATMSHEIRTPLNAVLGLTDLLLLTELNVEQRDYVETAQQSGQHLLALVNDILDISALEAGRMEYHDDPFSLAEVLDETTTMFVAQAERKGLDLRLDPDPGIPPLLRGDAVRVRQILVNVVGNALKFTETGSVRVSPRVTGRADGRCQLEVVVADTGIGVPKWRIPQLFRSFARGDVSSTRTYGGSGLGLAISRTLAEAMGGTIELDSELGHGTTVRITLDLAVVEEEQTAAVRSPDTLPHHGGLRVLVAEDDLVNQKVVKRMLQRLGVSPVIVANGQEAVDAVAEEVYDIILMDVQMPVMDGVRAVRLVRDLDPTPRPWVVALTANALSGDRERFMAAGMDDYVSKPMTIDSLAAALERASLQLPNALPGPEASGPRRG